MARRIIPIVIAALLLAAHFLRAGNLVLMAVCLATPLLLLIKKRWSLAAVQVFAWVGVIIWLGAAASLAQQRILWGQPWGRAAIIMAAVAMFTAFAGLLLNAAPVKEKYSPPADKTMPSEN